VGLAEKVIEVAASAEQGTLSGPCVPGASGIDGGDGIRALGKRNAACRHTGRVQRRGAKQLVRAVQRLYGELAARGAMRLPGDLSRNRTSGGYRFPLLPRLR
jgi:hypothetical protein